MKPFLSLPFKYKSYKITAGITYSAKETKISGQRRHYGIDYSLPRGTPILAAASGWAISSYHWHLLWDKVGKGRIRYKRYKGKLLGNGYGYFVTIYHPRQDLFTQYGHLDEIFPKIPFLEPMRRRLRFDTLVSRIKKSQFPKRGVWVRGGQVVGWCGDSGVTLGYRDYPIRPDPQKFPSWWETHLHFEVYTGRDPMGRKLKDFLLDPYDIDKTSRYYPWPGHPRPMGKNHLWRKI